MTPPQELRFTAHLDRLTVEDRTTGNEYVCKDGLSMMLLRSQLERAHQPEPVVTPRKARRLAQLQERSEAGQ